MKNLFLMVSVMLIATFSAGAHCNVLHPKHKVLNSNQADDTQELQAMLDKGGVVNLPAGKTFNISGTVYITKNNEIIYGNMCTIVYTGGDAAIDFQRINGQFYPVRITMSDLSVNVKNPGAVGIRWQASYSSLRNCSISVSQNNQTGFELWGDKNGSGSYYNLFENCFVQGDRQHGKTNQYGWKFSYDKSTPSRCPNTNMWIGGRVGQCDVGMYINGNGNVVDHIATEGCGVSFFFDNPDSPVGCVNNKVLYPYIESCKTGFRFGPHSISCVGSLPYMTSTPSIKEDAGQKNTFNFNQ